MQGNGEDVRAVSTPSPFMCVYRFYSSARVVLELMLMNPRANDVFQVSFPHLLSGAEAIIAHIAGCFGCPGREVM